jgi:hypothetical protein
MTPAFHIGWCRGEMNVLHDGCCAIYRPFMCPHGCTSRSKSNTFDRLESNFKDLTVLREITEIISCLNFTISNKKTAMKSKNLHIDHQYLENGIDIGIRADYLNSAHKFHILRNFYIHICDNISVYCKRLNLHLFEQWPRGFSKENLKFTIGAQITKTTLQLAGNLRSICVQKWVHGGVTIWWKMLFHWFNQSFFSSQF